MATDLQHEPLLAARDAFARHAWIEAFEHFSVAGATAPLQAEDLEAMGEAAWWTGHHDACISANERAFAAYIEANNPRRAAMVALALMVNHAALSRRGGPPWCASPPGGFIASPR